MALTQLYTAVADDVITSARWNNEFGNIYNNGTDVSFPLTKAVSLAGYTITLDAASVTTFISSTSIAYSFTPGAKTGTPGTTGGIVNTAASTYTDNNTAGAGTAAAWAGTAIQRPTLAASNANVTTTDAAAVYIANNVAAGTNETLTNSWALWIDNGAVRFDGNLRADGYLIGTPALGGNIYGLTYSRDAGDLSNDILVAIGGATSDDAAATSKRLMNLTASLIKRTDAAWAVGTNAGSLDTGAVGNVDYFVWLIMRADTGVVDVLTSISATAPTMPTNYAFKRLIGWFRRAGAANTAFLTFEAAGGGLTYLWAQPPADIALINTLTTTARVDVISVPVGISVLALLGTFTNDIGSAYNIVIRHPDSTDYAPAADGTANCGAGTSTAERGNVTVQTDTSAQIEAREAGPASVDSYYVATHGFIWSRR